MKRPVLATLTALAVLGLSSAYAQDGTITIGESVFPESITSTPHGDLLIGSFTQGTVFRVPAGTTQAEPWVTGIGPTVVGVFAHQDTVYVCSNGAFGSNQAALKTFDLATAEETGSYDFPEGGFCSDIAVSPSGEVYVSHLNFAEGGDGRVLRLTSEGLEVVLADPAIRGIDGIAFMGDTLIANDLLTGALYRIELAAAPVSYTPLTLSEPLSGPDGMRTTQDGTALLIVEQYGNRLVSVTVEGDTAQVTEIAGDLEGPAGVAQIGDTAYVVEARFSDMRTEGTLAPFVVRSVTLP